MPLDPFDSRDQLTTASGRFLIHRLDRLESAGLTKLEKLPFSIRILLESVLRQVNGREIQEADVVALAGWQPQAEQRADVPFQPARVIMQDFTGVPAVVDLAAMRSALARLGGDPAMINPQVPVDLVIDHSVQVDFFASAEALNRNAEMEFQRNRERYEFLRWGKEAFQNFRVVPPATGIVHQVNLEYLATVVQTAASGGEQLAYPDTLVGTDSHTTMINGLGVLGWGVGGIEAEAAILGQPMVIVAPDVVGFRLVNRLPEGTTATDLVLRVTEILRQQGVVGKFVEFFGPGLAEMSLPDRATIANMAPEYGATVGFFPVDRETLRYLRQTGRPDEQVDLVERYCREQQLFRSADTPDPLYTQVLELDLSSIEASLAGPKRPQDRIPLSAMKQSFQQALTAPVKAGGFELTPERLQQRVAIGTNGTSAELAHGSVVIAAITSCTNTSNPMVMVAAGLLARNALEHGLKPKPFVKTSLAPGSRVVTEYLRESGLLEPLAELGFNVVGYGCTTCIGNSGPLPGEVVRAISEGDLVASAVLSGNRNFEGRINPHVRANYLASPPLVVAYALAGRIDIDLHSEPLGEDRDGRPVFLKDVWPSRQEIDETVRAAVKSEMFVTQYGEVYAGDEQWRAMPVPGGDTYAWAEDSTYVKLPPYFVDLPLEPAPVADLAGARVLCLVGDSITTDHISPAGAIKADSPAGKYLIERGVAPKDFNSYGSRRGNHEVMMRGTFANVRFRNQLVPSLEGGFTLHLPDETPMTIFDAARRYRQEGVPLVVLAGKEYGTGSSRDWAAKGPSLLGVRAVIAASYERIHRSNLIGMGILPLEFERGASAETLGLTGHEEISIEGLAERLAGEFSKGMQVTVVARPAGGEPIRFPARMRIDTPQEAEYYRHGGILQYVLRQLL